MPHGSLLLAFIILVIIIAIIVPAGRKRSEGFLSGYNALAFDREKYIELGEQRYNRLQEQLDVSKLNYAKAESPEELKKAEEDIRQAMVSYNLEPSPSSQTFLGIQTDRVLEKLAPPNAILQEAKKCEAKTTRDACSILRDPNYSNCGVCIADGTKHDNLEPNAHIGGLLVLPEDRQYAEQMAVGGGPVQYEATIGSCPAGYLFVDAKTCEKEVNRLNCKEAGESGGFPTSNNGLGGRTKEKKPMSSLQCASVPSMGDDVYIYNPSGRKFNMNLRILTPAGTGQLRVWVKDSSGKTIATGESRRPGTDYVLELRNVQEAQELAVTVQLEVPHRPKGKREVFQYTYNYNGPNNVGYNETKETAADACRRIGARLATENELMSAWQNGMQLCSTGWTSGRVGYPMQGKTKSPGCGTRGINWWGSAGGTQGFSWCYGIKPPVSTGQVNNFQRIADFFYSFQNNIVPSEENKPNQWSQYGDYQAPYYRAVILQWESIDGTRIQPFEPSILRVNGMSNILRRFGTFEKSSLIQSSVSNSKILRNQFWIWSNQPNAMTTEFRTKIPGTFTNPFYPEDTTAGVLVEKPSTLALMQTSPCLKDNQTPGKYSMECLTNLYLGAGGDVQRGRLASEGRGLAQLNDYGSMDEISTYLSNLYTLATSGREPDGTRVKGANAKQRTARINNAAQLLFGFDIASPCEDIEEDARGNILLVEKTGPFDADCLDYLWMNTNKDVGRSDYRPATGNPSRLKPTYEFIWDRFSGLKSKESTQERRDQYPFQTCKRSGSAAPINERGQVNTANVMTANAMGRRTISDVQSYYNTMYENAASAKDETIQNRAIEQCYGIRPVVAKSKPCPV